MHGWLFWGARWKTPSERGPGHVSAALQVIRGDILSSIHKCPPPHDVGVLSARVLRTTDGAVHVHMGAVHTAASMGVGFLKQAANGDVEMSVKMLRQINRLSGGDNSESADVCIFGTRATWDAPQSGASACSSP